MLRADRLHKVYHGRTVLDEVSFEVEPGRILGLVGANGAGKSTTIKMLTGLVEPTGGSATIDGAPTTRAATRRRIGFLPEESPLWDELDVRALVRFFAGLYGVPHKVAKERTERLLDRLDLAPEHRKRPVGTLSKGMRRKVAVALALLHDPDVVVLDEPTSGLDPQTSRLMATLFVELRDAGKAVVLSAHNLPQVEEVCDQILLLHQGRVRASGSLQELRDTWGEHTYRVKATAPLPDGTAHGAVWEAVYHDWAAVDAALDAVRAAGGEVLELEAVPPRLEEILANVMGP